MSEVNHKMLATAMTSEVFLEGVAMFRSSDGGHVFMNEGEYLVDRSPTHLVVEGEQWRSLAKKMRAYWWGLSRSRGVPSRGGVFWVMRSPDGGFVAGVAKVVSGRVGDRLREKGVDAAMLRFEREADVAMEVA